MASPLLREARNYYCALEQTLHHPFFHDKTMLRVFKSDRERRRFNSRKTEPDYAPFLGKEIAQIDGIHTPFGAAQQLHTGFLDTCALLNALKQYFIEQRIYIEASFHYETLQLQEDGVTWRNLRPARIVFCEGAMARENPWFKWLPFQPAKGEILTIRSAQQLPDQIINAGQ